MKSKRSGSRYPLLFYRRTLGRLALGAFVLGLTLIVVWGWSLIEPHDILFFEGETLVLLSAVASFGIALVAFIARGQAYVKPYHDFVLIATPFLHIRVSYRRIRSLHPALIQQVFPPEKQSWTQKRFLAPFIGKTALILELRGYPLNRMLLQLFLPRYMFYPQGDGFVLLVSDWMKFSTEFDSFTGAWLQTRGNSTRR